MFSYCSSIWGFHFSLQVFLTIPSNEHFPGLTTQKSFWALCFHQCQRIGPKEQLLASLSLSSKQKGLSSFWPWDFLILFLWFHIAFHSCSCFSTIKKKINKTELNKDLWAQLLSLAEKRSSFELCLGAFQALPNHHSLHLCNFYFSPY